MKKNENERVQIIMGKSGFMDARLKESETYTSYNMQKRAFMKKLVQNNEF